MSVFVDTSALYSLFDRDDANHLVAAAVWESVVADETPLLTSNYVLVETLALLQRRLGLVAVRDFQDAVLPLLQVMWVNEELHQMGMQALLTANRRQLSIVDCVSFAICHQRRLMRVFAFDAHFSEQGFSVLTP